MLGALNLRSFRLIWMGQLLSQFGNVFLEVAALWLLQLRSPSYLAAAGAVMLAPAILAALGGALVDHFGPRRLMILTDVFRTLGVGLMVLLVAVHPAGTPLFLLVALGLTSLGGALFSPGEGVLIPLVVDDDRLASANGLMQSTGQSAATVGYALGGAALLTVGTTLILGFDAFTYAVSALTILLIPAPMRRGPKARGGAPPLSLGALREGYAALRGLTWFLRLVPILVALNALVNGAFIMLPYWVHHHLGATAVVYGALIASWTGGQLIGSFTAGAWSRFPVWRVIVTASVVNGLLFLAFAIDPSPVGEGVALALAGAANGVMNALFFVILQRLIPEDVRGRAFGLLTSLLTLGNPFGALLAGLTTSILPLAWPWITGALLILGFGFLLARSSAFRSVRSGTAQEGEAVT